MVQHDAMLQNETSRRDKREYDVLIAGATVTVHARVYVWTEDSGAVIVMTPPAKHR